MNDKHSHPQLKNTRILLVEDNEINQLVAKKLLNHLGALVTVAKNGAEAVQLLQDSPQAMFDVILMDVQMPIMGGREAAQKIRRLDNPNSSLPIIALSADDFPEEREKNLASGMDAHIDKPIDLDQLLDGLAQLLPTQIEAGSTADSASPPDTAPQITIPGIDTTLGLRRAVGNVDLYLELLESFAANQRNAMQTFYENFERGEHQQNAFLAHTIKGTSGTLGAMDLFSAADEVERACRNGSIQPKQLAQLEERLTDTLQQINAYFSRAATSQLQSKTPKAPVTKTIIDPSNPTILIIEDSEEIIKVLVEMLKTQYNILITRDGQQGMAMSKQEQPDLILLDILMKPVDGYQVCAELKQCAETQDIPVIFLTAVSEYLDEARGFEIGAVDYITKPFVPVVVLARIKHHLQLAMSLKELQRLYKLALDSNPITQLPGNNSIHQHINELLETEAAQHVLYIDIDNFKSFNDAYGFAKGDEVIAFVADLMTHLMQELSVQEGFVGHIGGDDFMVTLGNQAAMDYIEALISRFEEKVKTFYTAEDVAAGFIRTKNRRGEAVDFPIMTLSVVGVNLAQGHYPNYFRISDICAELKHHAKNIPGSTVLIDRRST